LAVDSRHLPQLPFDFGFHGGALAPIDSCSSGGAVRAGLILDPWAERLVELVLTAVSVRCEPASLVSCLSRLGHRAPISSFTLDFVPELRFSIDNCSREDIFEIVPIGSHVLGGSNSLVAAAGLIFSERW